MLKATKVRRGHDAMGEPPLEVLTLDHEARQRRRLRFVTASGLELLLDLKAPGALADGDRLVLDDGSEVLIRAAPEPVADLRAHSPHHLARLAWHLGNRHTSAQILEGAIRIRRDHVLLDLARRLGAEIVELEAPFEPEGGAYAAHGH